MSDRDIPPLAPDLRALVEIEGTRLAPAGAIDRIGLRLDRTLAALPDRDPAPDRPRAGGRSARSIAGAVTTFVAGGVVGAALRAVLAPPPPERIVFVDRPA